MNSLRLALRLPAGRALLLVATLAVGCHLALAAPGAGTPSALQTNNASAPAVLAGKPARPAGVRWQRETDRVDADVADWPLRRALESISRGTGWQVFVDPKARRSVTARFSQIPGTDAVKRLLGELNYAILPQTNGPTRLFVYRAAIADATQRIRPEGGNAETIGNELLVRLKPGSDEDIDALARRLGAKVTGRIDGQKAYRLSFDTDEAAAKARAGIATDDDIASVDYNNGITAPALLQPSLGGVPPLPDRAPTGDHVIVALIDSAVQTQMSAVQNLLLPGVSLAGDTLPPADQPSHGTAMAETIARGSGTADLRILPIDVYGGNEMTTSFDVVRGIYAAVEGGASVINFSLTSETGSSFLNQVIAEAHAKGITLVGAAGNEPTTAPMYPAAWPEVIATTAADRRGGIAPWANHGDFVDVVAPGSNLFRFGLQSYQGTGTSFSSAYVSGWAASYLTSHPGATPAEVAAQASFIAKPPAPAGTR